VFILVDKLKYVNLKNTIHINKTLNFFEQKARVTKLTLSKTRVLRIGELWSNCNKASPVTSLSCR